jgi:hypothetical protein
MKYTVKAILPLILLLAFSATTVHAQLSVGVSVHIGPPAIPVYEQPLCPTDGYLWIPGYWGYGDDGYYWVPGYWEAPPTVGFLWTPGYWGYAGGLYGWHGGYWGPHIGFYGGVNYGYGYGGSGYYGGGWVGGRFRYNTAVTRVNTTVIHNTYIDRTVIRNTTENRVSYNGGPGGVNARPSAQEQSAMQEHHIQATSAQVQHEQTARSDRGQLASVNHGRPATAAVARPTAYHPANTGGAAGHPAATGGAQHPADRSAANMSHTPAANHTPAVNHTSTVNHPPTINRTPATHSQPQVHTMNRPTQPAGHPGGHPAGGGHPAAPREGGGGGGEHHHR